MGHEDDFDGEWRSWDDWLAELSEEDRRRAVALRDRFAGLGASDPEGWARSEVSEGFAHMARFVFLKAISTRVLTPFDSQEWIEPALQFPRPLRDAMERVRAAGLPVDVVVAIAAYVAEDVAFSVLNCIDGGYNVDIDDADLPGWRLMETVEDPQTGRLRLTGRDVGGLHESMYEVHHGD